MITFIKVKKGAAVDVLHEPTKKNYFKSTCCEKEFKSILRLFFVRARFCAYLILLIYSCCLERRCILN
jgi:hypothetical protein